MCPDHHQSCFEKLDLLKLSGASRLVNSCNLYRVKERWKSTNSKTSRLNFLHRAIGYDMICFLIVCTDSHVENWLCLQKPVPVMYSFLPRIPALAKVMLIRFVQLYVKDSATCHTWRLRTISSCLAEAMLDPWRLPRSSGRATSLRGRITVAPNGLQLQNSRMCRRLRGVYSGSTI